LATAPWLHIRPPTDTSAVQALLAGSALHAGEAEAIILAHELGALLVIDERDGRRRAAALGITLTGTAGIVARAKALGVIPSVRPVLDALATAGLRLSPIVVAEVLGLAGEAE